MSNLRPASPPIGGPLLVGLLLIVGFFGGFAAWSHLAPLATAAIAPGRVVLETNRKAVQHLEGGIVSEVLVREGDLVAAGQVLFRLDATRSRAEVQLLQDRWLAAMARRARLEAERDRLPAVEPLPELRRQASAVQDAVVNIAPILAAQQRIFVARREALESQVATILQRGALYQEEIRGLEAHIQSQDQQLTLIADELQGIQTLYDKGLAEKGRLLELKRRTAQIRGERGLNVAEIARAEQAAAEGQLSVTQLRADFSNQVVAELEENQADIFDLTARLVAAQDVITRTEVRAPRAGKVVGLAVHTPGAVIAPGDHFLDIVPGDERLVIEAQVEPGDIDQVRRGLPAQVRLSALNGRTTLPMDAEVLDVSADTLFDERSGRRYYLARLSFPEVEARAALGEAPLRPGMEAEVIIESEEQTVLGYLIEPITRTVRLSMREE